MSVFQFIASLVASLAWPAAIVIIFIILRRPISKVILSLNRLAYKDLELNFSQVLTKLGAKADEANIPDQIPQTPILPNQSLAAIHPDAAVLITWNNVEKEILALAKRSKLPDDIKQRRLLKPLIEALKAAGIIDADTAEILFGMRNLRNIAAHPRGDEKQISYADAIEYEQLGERIIQKLRSIQ